MTYQGELLKQRDEISQLVRDKDFLTDFQKTNYNLLIANYYEPADNSARDYDTAKIQHDKLKEGDPKQAGYKAKMTKAEIELKPNKEALDGLKKEISTMEQLILKIDAINTKIDGLGKGGNQPAQPQTIPCPCDIKGLTDKTDKIAEKLNAVNKKIDTIPSVKDLKNKEIAEQILKNNKDLQDLDTKTPTIATATTNPDLFIKALKEDSDKSHFLLRQDPITKLWGVAYFSKSDKNQIHFFTGTKATYTEENARLAQLIKDQGITSRAVSNYNSYDMNPSKSEKYSLLWVLGMVKIWPDPKLGWDDIKDESKWKPQIEAEYNKYDN